MKARFFEDAGRITNEEGEVVSALILKVEKSWGQEEAPKIPQSLVQIATEDDKVKFALEYKSFLASKSDREITDEEI